MLAKLPGLVVFSFCLFVCVCGGVKFVGTIARIFAICWGQIFQLPYIIRRNPCWLTWETISKWEIGSCKRVSVCVRSIPRTWWKECVLGNVSFLALLRVYVWGAVRMEFRFEVIFLLFSLLGWTWDGWLVSLAQTRGIVARGVNRKATGLRQTRLRNLLLSAEQRLEGESTQTDSHTCRDTCGNNTCDWCEIVWIIVKAEFSVVLIAVWFVLIY